MSKVIGEGSYGCVHKPSLICKTKKMNYENKISKIMTKKHLNDEIREYKKIKKVDKHHDIHLGTPSTCVPDKKNAKYVDQCDNFNGNEMNKYMLMILSDGGQNLEEFARSCNKLRSTRSNKKMMQNFWVECHRLLYGIYLMQQHGVMHHDLKPQNIVYNAKKNRINFIDFGLMIDKDIVLKDIRDSRYSLAIPFWYFPFEFMFLNKNTFLRAAALNDNNISKNEIMEKLSQNQDALKYMKMFYDNTINDTKFINKNNNDFYSTVVSIKMNNYEDFVNKSLDTIDIYGTGMAMLYVLRRTSHLIDTKLYNEFHELFLQMITASLDKRLTIDILLSKYEDIIIKHKLLNKMYFENHKLKPIKINKLNNKIKNTTISLKEKKRLTVSPIYNKTRRNIKRSQIAL